MRGFAFCSACKSGINTWQPENLPPPSLVALRATTLAVTHKILAPQRLRLVALLNIAVGIAIFASSGAYWWVGAAPTLGGLLALWQPTRAIVTLALVRLPHRESVWSSGGAHLHIMSTTLTFPLIPLTRTCSLLWINHARVQLVALPGIVLSLICGAFITLNGDCRGSDCNLPRSAAPFMLTSVAFQIALVAFASTSVCSCCSCCLSSDDESIEREAQRAQSQGVPMNAGSAYNNMSSSYQIPNSNQLPAGAVVVQLPNGTLAVAHPMPQASAPYYAQQPAPAY